MAAKRAMAAAGGRLCPIGGASGRILYKKILCIAGNRWAGGLCLGLGQGQGHHHARLLSSSSVTWSSSLKKEDNTFNSSKLRITFSPPNDLKPKPPDADKLGFGKHFTDHMLVVKWNNETGWGDPEIGPLKPFQMHPAAKVLHYAQELFEGMKVYRGVDDRIRFFRPLHNMARMIGSARRACFPTFNGGELIHCIRKLVQIEQEWVPHVSASSLYIRPTMIGVEPTLGVGPSNEVHLFVILSPVGPYFSGGLKPVNLLADPKYIRAWPGGCGYVKMGSNYAPTLYTQKIAEKYGCQQCLWLLGEDHEITEVGAMNIFVLLRKPGGGGDLELVTPSLDSGVILPGVTRRSVLEMTREWNEFEVSERKITMKEVLKAKDEDRLVEVFGTGTAAIVSQVGNIHYNGTMHAVPNSAEDNQVSVRILNSMSDIYYGKVKHPWAVDIEAWTTESTPLETDRLKRYEESITKHLAMHR